MLNHRRAVGEATGHGELHLVLVLVRPVPAPAFGLPEHGLRQGFFPGQLPHVVGNAVFVGELRGLELPRRRLQAQAEGDAGVDHRLPLHHPGKVLRGDGDISKHLQVRHPAGPGAGLPLGKGRFFQLLARFALDLPLFEMELIGVAVPPDGDVHVR